MKTIWKFPLMLTDKQTVSMPLGANVLTAQLQGDTITVWAEVADVYAKTTESRTFVIVGTGRAIPPIPLRYIATVQMDEYVWHVYEVHR